MIGTGGDSGLVGLIARTLSQTSLSGLREMLKAMTEELGCQGAILWEVAPFSELEATPPTGNLFILGQYFRGEKSCAFHNLPLDSVAGKVALTQRREVVPDIHKSGVVRPALLDEIGIQSFYSLPVRFVDDSRGALNFFRTELGHPSEAELARASDLASLVPALYHSVRERVSLELIRQVNFDVQKALARIEGSKDDEGRPLDGDETTQVFHSICKHVSATFDCVETTILLEDWREAPGEFKVRASTWPSPVPKPSYRASVDDGYTGWVLARGKPVRFFDLNHYARDRELLERLYPDLRWLDSWDIRKGVWSILTREPDPEMPLSMMAVPIVIGTRVIGVLRCSVARAGTYFSERDLRLLALVAAQVALYWNDVLNRKHLREENRSLKALVENVARLNTFALGEISRGAADEKRIFKEAFVVTRDVFPWAEAFDVRLRDVDGSNLAFTQVDGPAWHKGTSEEIDARRSRKVPAAAFTPFLTGVPEIVEPAEPASSRRPTFPGMTRLTAPIRAGEDTRGVLDVWASGRVRVPEYAVDIAQLLGNQLGLYHHLTTIVAKLRGAEADLKKHAEQQQQIFQDLGHQLQTPLSQAHARAQALLDERGASPEDVTTRLRAIRGLLAKSVRVTRSLRLFVALAQKKSVAVSRTRMDHEWLLKMLIEAASDQELMVDPVRRIRFDVQRPSLDALKRHHIELDRDLLEQAVANVLDNAGKYSYSNTVVEISGGVTSSGRPFLSVSNQGIRLRPDEVRECVERGWRSEAAESVVQEGSGIGLWIVNNIVRAHGGELLVDPTNDKGRTVVRIVFPTPRKG